MKKKLFVIALLALFLVGCTSLKKPVSTCTFELVNGKTIAAATCSQSITIDKVERECFEAKQGETLIASGIFIDSELAKLYKEAASYQDEFTEDAKTGVSSWQVSKDTVKIRNYIIPVKKSEEYVLLTSGNNKQVINSFLHKVSFAEEK